MQARTYKIEYTESCFDCDSVNLDIRNIVEKDAKLMFEVVCRECGSTWNDWEEVPE